MLRVKSSYAERRDWASHDILLHMPLSCANHQFLFICFAEKAYEMCSFSESSAMKLANACPEEFVNHNKRFLSRIYPNGMRVDSSNYNPVDLWNCGCQLGKCWGVSVNSLPVELIKEIVNIRMFLYLTHWPLGDEIILNWWYSNSY